MEQSHTHIKEKKAIALSSVGAAIFLTGMKLVVGLETNSLGILSEAAHSGLDLLAALMTYFAVSISDKPADEDHQYGHGKVENISALMETVLLVITCGWIVREAIHRLTTGSVHVEATVWSYVVVTIAIFIDIGRSRALGRVARKYDSQALEADALHFSSDVWSSLTVLAGLVCVSLGYTAFDSIAAIGVALLVLFVSYRLGKRTIDALMDRVPHRLAEAVQQTIRSIAGVEELRNTRLRSSGAKIFVDATVAVRRTTPFAQVHLIMDEIEEAIQAVHPNADIVVHAEPVEGKDETLADKIRMIVVGKGLRAPHNLEVYQSNGKYFIDFDVEYQKGKTFTEAHDMASEIEHQIHRDLQSVEKVTIHMEEYQPTETELDDVTKAEQRLAEQIRAVVEKTREVLSCSDLTLLREGNKYRLTLTCRMKKTRTLEEVHQIISKLETELYQQFKQVRRITIHAEPA
ncbi:MAG: cation diffusion facilitator family transporter [Bacteroidota bacterium]